MLDANRGASPGTRIGCGLVASTIGIVAVALGACGGGGQVAPRVADCAGLAPEDSSFLAAGPVYRECSVDSRARLITPNVRVDYKPSTMPAPGRTICYSAQLRFVVDARGIPEVETARVVRTNEARFGEAVLASLNNWRFQPAQRQGEAVRQIVDERRAMGVAVAVVRAGQAASPPPPSPPCR